VQRSAFYNVQWSTESYAAFMSSADLTLSVGNDVIQPVTVVRDLSVYLDNELTMKQHIGRVVSSCFFQLRRLHQIRRSAGEEVT